MVDGHLYRLQRRQPGQLQALGWLESPSLVVAIFDTNCTADTRWCQQHDISTGAGAGACWCIRTLCARWSLPLLLTWMKLLSNMGMCWNRCTHPCCSCPMEPRNTSSTTGGCRGHHPPTASYYYSCLSFIRTVAHPLWNLHLGLNRSPSGPPLNFCCLLWPAALTQHRVLMPTAAPTGRGSVLLQTATHPEAESVRHARSVLKYFNTVILKTIKNQNYSGIVKPVSDLY